MGPRIFRNAVRCIDEVTLLVSLRFLISIEANSDKFQVYTARSYIEEPYLPKKGPGEHATLNPQTPILLSLPVLETYLLHLDRGPLQSLLKNFSIYRRIQSSRRFPYGYLVTTSPQSKIPP
ncbi:orf120a (mitochondrion) [Brassica oleracea]|uniref:Orf120a n=3 Tax=Brassica oleracea TaxID=3712 RepID=G4XYH8_BRAOL|nr:orf120a [Brassica oleracea]AIC83251.1 orf120 [Brassica oleracea var. botrytis]AOW69017.1 orf120a [Brassica oleracea var. capitata]AEH43533.1 orf120a [Brassica oleracea]WAS35336.1 hypothetical protein [Brassica oleracea]WAS35428.1 hypothetical protein [Brassica oleracea]